MNLDQVLHAFIAESRELLAEMESALLGIQATEGEARSEAINAIFRAAHTIKGSAGLFGLDRIVAFTHVVESVLDEVRAGRYTVDDPMVALMLACGDHMRTLIDAAEIQRGDPDAGVAAQGEPLLQRLAIYLPGADATPGQSALPDAVPAPAGRRWQLSVRFGTEVLRNGMDPLAFIRYLGTLGTLVRVRLLADRLPGLQTLDPEACHLAFEIELDSEASQEAIEAVFEFVRDDCELHVQAVSDNPATPTPSPASQIASLPPAPDPAASLEAPASAAAPTARPTREARTGERASVRVDADKLDRLIDLVGELVTASAGAHLVARKVRVPELLESHEALAALVEQVRDTALQLRMVKIGTTFSRFQRVVHDVSREIGKDIGLVVDGEDTELDKTVVERIADPLTHLVRNAIDHGIEPAEQRLARGKPARGTVGLNAYHDSGSVVIEVSDDGGGLNRDRILAKGLERGLVEPGKHLSDAEIFNLIFEPGFSTAAQITNLSGRGVGMDVVKRNIAALRGSVQIRSTEGHGTTVTVRLPLTLAIIDGFQVRVGRSVFVVPLEMVEECVAFANQSSHDYTDLRGQVLPVVRLRELFGVQGARGTRDNLVVVTHAGQKAGLVVDALLGEVQTVIKPLNKMFGRVPGIGGSSILGTGEVALILDVPGLLQQAQAAALGARSAAVTA
ncbi:chemotaxis protein CheA [Aquabacterium sp. A7-Y]|uniref:chemotaxis protein CheA n=1 Tax=Aquabacterium sp. A7-Y TaxID=1349605 RepID=UPI00223D59EB|nr:chemotaxis protein CheA [Aquabacterium sp. A7-Y]MCW7537082.1 chemotaxis protein CheA [Aquabacterium sp. A7-Y]